VLARIRIMVVKMSNLRVLASQFELAGGLRREKGDFLVDAEMWMPPAALQKRGNLYIIAEIEGDNPEYPSPQAKEYCQEAQMTILEEYYNFNATASITSALRHALERGNQQIFNRNSATLPPNRRGVGVSCAVVRGNELFLAQMPPTQAFVVHQGQLRYYPANFGQNNNDIEYIESMPIAGTRHVDTPPSLGRYAQIEPTFNRVVFDDGDLLVLCSSKLAGKLTLDQAERYFNGEEGRRALFNLADFARSQNISDGYALSISVRGDYSTHQLDRAAAERSEFFSQRNTDNNPIRGALEGVVGAVSLLTSQFTPTKERPEPPQNNFTYQQSATVEPPRTVDDLEQAVQQATPRGQASAIDPVQPEEPRPHLKQQSDNLKEPPFFRDQRDQFEKTPEPDAMPPQANVFRPPTPEEVAQARAAVENDSKIPPAEPKPRVFSYTGTTEPKPPKPPVTPFPQPKITIDTEDVVPPVESKKRTFSFFGGKAKPTTTINPGQGAPDPYFDMVGGDGYLPPESLKEERKRLKGGLNFGNLWIKAGLAGLIAIAILFLLFAVVSVANFGGGDNNKALDLVKQAEQKRIVAQQLAATDPIRARTIIRDANADLDLAVKEKKDLPEIVTTRNALRVTLDQIDRVTVPNDLRLSTDLTGQGTGVKVTSTFLASTNDAVFMLDSGRNQILLQDLQGVTRSILKAGDKASNRTFNKALAIAPRLDSIIVIDGENAAWVYDRKANSWAASLLGSSANWAVPIQKIDTYQGNLYVIGPAGGQVLRFLAGNYAAKPDEWLDNNEVDKAGLNKATAFAIDGRIYSINSEGIYTQMARPDGKTKGEVLNQFNLNANAAVNPPLKNPTKLIVGTLDYPYIFVIDGQKRILQFQKSNGQFIQQFKTSATGKELDNLNDIYFDEVNKKLFAVGDNRIYVFRVPSAPPLNPVTTSTTVLPNPTVTTIVTPTAKTS
jgi:serine/threonine protein phosphatase PrpC